MDSIVEKLNEFIPENFDLKSILIMAAIFTVASLIFGLIGRFVFGKKSNLNQSVSSAIGILFIYIVTIFVHSFGLDLKFLLSPLPFFSIHATETSGDILSLYIPLTDYVALSSELLNMIILAFLANIANSLIPQGKNLFTWLLFRIISIALAMVLFTLVNNLLAQYLPEGLLTWAPVILLALLVIMLLLGALKGLFGAVLATVNPLIGFLYTFFFANIVGKMLSKAMLTTLLIGALIYALNHFGIMFIAISSGVLTLLIPLLIVLILIWYIVGKLL